VIAEGEELKDKPLPLRYFGRDFVLYRGASGKPHLLDAYCPHMGTHLGINTTSYVVKDGAHIEGESIRCPYHGWRFRADGVCDDIPYNKGPIPKAACVRSWQIVESMGVIWVWHDPENGTPEWESPSLKEWDDPAWVRWKLDHLGILNQHPQELIDNIVDFGHFDPIHGSHCQYFENEFHGHLATQRMGGGHRTLTSSEGMLKNDTTYNGPGFLLSRMTGGPYESIILIAHTPVDDGKVKAWHGLLVKSSHESATRTDIVLARGYQAASMAAFAQDFEVWSNKAPAINILQVAMDGRFDLERTWYKQFYNPRARAAEFQKKIAGVHPVRGFPAAPRKAVGE
jgi:3-ketosteroid 9alpha-monooxygenase subunit A